VCGCVNMSLAVTYEHIRCDFWNANYIGFQIVMIKSMGYINVSNLCRMGGKKIRQWLSIQSNREIISILDKKVYGNATESKSVLIEMGHHEGSINDTIEGIYAHYLLVTHIANWIGNGFGFLVNHIINDFRTVKSKESVPIEERLESVTEELTICKTNLMLYTRSNANLTRQNKKLI
jgi:KilA-N domain